VCSDQDIGVRDECSCGFYIIKNLFCLEPSKCLTPNILVIFYAGIQRSGEDQDLLEKIR